MLNETSETSVMTSHVLTICCPARGGIIAAVSGYLADNGCNIRDCAQFIDSESSRLFMRLTFEIETGSQLSALSDGFSAVAARFAMEFAFHNAGEKMRVIIMVSRFGHCLNDLLYRSRIGSLPVHVAAVISNHTDYRKAVIDQGIPFHHVAITPDTKPEAETKMLRIVEETKAELVVLARYMQVLSDELCRKMSGRIINIHHSFLPSFKGANPYKQAYERGVRLIGATAHYVTADLDEGPIIEQDTIRVTHAQSAADYVSLGRDVEAQVLARAIHAHIHHRVFVNGTKTVVFPASPGSYASKLMG
jgi:formyltetrahydrofolate deformylase